MENRNNTKRIVEAGMLTAITVILIIIVGFVPVLGTVCFFVLPLPTAILYIKHSLKTALASIFAGILVSCMIVGLLSGISLGIIYGFSGIALGYCFSKEVKQSRSLLIMTGSLIVGFVILIGVNLLFIDRNSIVNIINTAIESTKQIFQSSVASSSANSDQAKMIKDMLNNLTPQKFMELIPAVIIVYSFIISFADYVIAGKILKRLGFKVVELVPFDKVYIDNRIGALLIIFACVGIIMQRYNMAAGNYILNSSVTIMSFTFDIVGSALIYYFLKNKARLSNASSAVFTIAILLMAGPLVFYLGFTDMIMDFRKVDPNRLFKSRIR